MSRFATTLFLFAFTAGTLGLALAIYGFFAAGPFELTLWELSSFVFGLLSIGITTSESTASQLPSGLAEAFPGLRRIQSASTWIGYGFAAIVAVGILGLMVVGIVLAPLAGLVIAVLGPIFGWMVDLSQFDEPFSKAFNFIWGIGAAALCYFAAIKALYGRESSLF